MTDIYRSSQKFITEFYCLWSFLSHKISKIVINIKGFKCIQISPSSSFVVIIHVFVKLHARQTHNVMFWFLATYLKKNNEVKQGQASKTERQSDLFHNEHFAISFAWESISYFSLISSFHPSF